ncbi:MAG: RNA polymerase sigma factor [Myxococcales bacterium]
MVSEASPVASVPPSTGLQLRDVVVEHLDFVWRTLRNLGVSESELEDELQKVFIVLTKHLPDLHPSQVRSFLFGTSRRVASHARRARQRRREEPFDSLAEPVDRFGDPEQQVTRSQSLEMLVAILDQMSEEMRQTFILYELEQLTLAEIAEMQQVPLGTVASRLRRARAHFNGVVEGLKRREQEESNERP